MSAQGAILRSGTVHLPIWPVAVLVVAAVATLIGLSSLDGAGPTTIRTVTESERIATSSAAVREQGAVLPVTWGVSHVTPSATGFAGFENPGAYVTPSATGFAGFENPGAYVTQAPTYAPGLENPGAYPAGSTTEINGLTSNPCPASCQLARR